MGIIFALLYPFIIIVYALLMGALIASLVVFINNIRSGSRNSWPVKNIVGAIISGLILTVAIIATIDLSVYAVNFFSSSSSTSSSSSIENAAIAITSMNL